MAASHGLLTMYQQREDRDPECLIRTEALMGRNGLGKEKEGDGKTPVGTYRFLFAFGTQPKPETAFPYIRIREDHYWIDDSDSIYYNRLVTSLEGKRDWCRGEHLIQHQPAYHYALALDYNHTGEKGRGSAVFLHCFPTEGAGCIAISEDAMIFILKRIKPGCKIAIGNELY